MESSAISRSGANAINHKSARQGRQGRAAIALGQTPQGQNDQLVQWFRPAKRPDWITAAQWRDMPDSLLVREVRRTINRFRRRPITLTIMTTLLDPKA